MVYYLRRWTKIVLSVYPLSTFEIFYRSLIELLQPENLANTWAWYTETVDSCFDLIRSHQQCIRWSPLMEIEPATTKCRAETQPLSHCPHRTQLHSVVARLISSSEGHCVYCWWDLMMSKHLSSVFVCHAGFSDRGNSIHDIISWLKMKNIHFIGLSWSTFCVFLSVLRLCCQSINVFLWCWTQTIKPI